MDGTGPAGAFVFLYVFILGTAMLYAVIARDIVATLNHAVWRQEQSTCD